MKNLIIAIALLIGVSSVSCKKEANTAPQTPSVAKMITVEYRIQSESGDLNATYLAPNAAGEMESINEAITRNAYSVTFEIMSGQYLSCEAYNLNPSHRTVQIELYINGILMKQSISNSPSVKASVSGTYF